MKATAFFLLITLLISTSCTSENNRFNTDIPVSLLNENIQGNWKPSASATVAFTDSGMILSGKESTVIYTGDTTQNIDITLTFQLPAGAKASLFFNAHETADGSLQGYNIQLNNSEEAEPKPGSLKQIRNLYIPFMKESSVNMLRTVVVANHIQIWLNDALVVDYRQPENPYRTAETSEMLVGSGLVGITFSTGSDPISISAFDVKIPEENEQTEASSPDDNYIRSVTKLHTEGYPLVDYHIHLKGDLTMEQALAHAAATGINYGIAVNCGQDFPINSEAKLDSFFNTLTPEPVFYAMQAEGREWLDLFSEESRQQFDYVFTDAMTYTENDGNRVHLWKPEEVHIEDAEKFMDFYVEKITEVMEEPIDIFVNPTFLPEVIRDQYNTLWTEERMEKVINAAVKNDVVMEINCRYRIPSYAFLKKGKEMGLKFSCGTNNTNREIGLQKYFIDMIDSCHLVPTDLYFPEL